MVQSEAELAISLLAGRDVTWRTYQLQLQQPPAAVAAAEAALMETIADDGSKTTIKNRYQSCNPASLAVCPLLSVLIGAYGM